MVCFDWTSALALEIAGRIDLRTEHQPIGEANDEAGEHDEIGASELGRGHVDRRHHREVDVAGNERLLRQRAFQVKRFDVDAIFLEELALLGDPQHRDIERRQGETGAQTSGACRYVKQSEK